MSNRLAKEQSPYLLQHKDNPVDWYPWGEDAFRRARDEDRPIFLSIGYSTCHWCHVMEHESFEDEAVAALMNESFVSVKVDREERPDIDGVYMQVCQMMTGQGGWPLTVIMTPDQKPFYAATYIPKEGRFGRIGMMELVPRLMKVWEEEREKVVDSAAHVTRSLIDAAGGGPAGEAVGESELHEAFQQLRSRFDAAFGGFGEAPKFPSPHNLLLLLRYWKRTGETAALEMVEKTLTHMRAGGIFDHIGFGVHRYATDRQWVLPHFEKMLYDQAMIAMAYTEAYQATGTPAYAAAVHEVFSYVLRNMTAPEGGFYSAEDADSEGREGKFYVWTLDEIREVLGDEAGLAIQVFNLAEEGNFREEATREKTGENVPFMTRSIGEIAADWGISSEELAHRLEAVRLRLFEHRERRVPPGKDDKILTDWNGLMIAALAKAARVLNTPEYAEAATDAVSLIRKALIDDEGRLLHRYRHGDAGVQANLDDYAYLTWGLLELYETTFDVELLKLARVLTDQLVQRFHDREHGGFFFTPDDGELLIARQKEFYDGALPSGNAVSMLNLLRLARITGETDFEKIAATVGRAAGDQVRRMPSGFSALLTAVDFGLGPAYEVVIAGDPEADDTRLMLSALHGAYIPNKVVLLRPPGEAAEVLAALAPFTAGQAPLAGRATAYVCREFSCEAPTTEIGEMLERLGVSR